MHLYLWFDEGKPISFGCAGNGEVHTLKISEPVACPESTFESLHALEGATLKRVARGPSVLQLETDAGTILLTNDCDHFQVQLESDK